MLGVIVLLKQYHMKGITVVLYIGMTVMQSSIKLATDS